METEATISPLATHEEDFGPIYKQGYPLAAYNSDPEGRKKEAGGKSTI